MTQVIAVPQACRGVVDGRQGAPDESVTSNDDADGCRVSHLGPVVPAHVDENLRLAVREDFLEYPNEVEKGRGLVILPCGGTRQSHVEASRSLTI